MRYLTFILAASLLLGNGCAKANIIIGRIIDSKTREPLAEAMVATGDEDPNSDNGATRYPILHTDSTGRFCTEVKGPLSMLVVNYPCYYKYSRTFIATSSKDTLRMGDILLIPSEVLLKEARVTGHAKRFYLKGDTIVFNPAAFHLQEGDRLEDLLKKMPNFTYEKGKLLFLGKPVRIMMNGYDLFDGGTSLVSRLPVAAIDRLKTYDKGSELHQRTGRKDGKEDRVLDIVVKPGWLDRWYGDVTGGVQSGDRYLAKVDAQRLSKTTPILAYGQMNDVNDFMGEKTFDSGGGFSDGNFGKQQFGSMGIQTLRKVKDGGKERLARLAVVAQMAHNDTWNNQHQNIETYLPGTTPAYTLSASGSNQCLINPSVNTVFSWNPDTLSTLSGYVNLKYNKTLQDNGTSSITGTGVSSGSGLGYGSGAEPDDMINAADSSSIGRSRVNSTKQYGHNETEGGSLEQGVHYYRMLKDESEVNISNVFTYSGQRALDFNRQDIHYYREVTSAQFINQYARTPSHQLDEILSADYSRWIGKHVQATITYTLEQKNDYQKRDFYRLDRLAGWNDPLTALLGNRPMEEDSLLKARDADNSLLRRQNTTSNTIRLSSTIQWLGMSIKPALSYNMNHEKLRYQRARIDTSAVRNTRTWSPELNVSLPIGHGASIEGGYKFQTSYPDLLETLAYRDDTDPLNITEGNPALHRYYAYETFIGMRMMLPAHQQTFYLEAGYHKDIHTPQTVTYYNALTGAYRMRQENGRGGNARFCRTYYEQMIGYRIHASSLLNITCSDSYGLLAVVGENGGASTGQALNHQRSTQLHWMPDVSFNFEPLQAKLMGKFFYQRLRNSQSPSSDANLRDYSCTANLQYTWKNFVVSTDMSVEGYSGYLTDAMNRSRFLWNADISMRVLKHKGKISLHFDDLLNKNTSYSSTSEAYRHSEQWSHSIHHYVCLSFTYHLDAKAKQDNQQEN